MGCADEGVRGQQANGSDPKPTPPVLLTTGDGAGAAVVSGIFLAIATVWSPAQGGSDAKRNMINGSCTIKTGKEADRKCTNVYILVSNVAGHSGESQDMRAWVDTHGDFAIAWKPGQRLKLVAVSDHYGMRSSPLEMSQPGIVNITLDLSAITP
jgi:hypothetical protein